MKFLRRLVRDLKARRGPKKAAIAVAASILTAVYHMLKDGTFYQDLGADYLVKRDPARTVAKLARRISGISQANPEGMATKTARLYLIHGLLLSPVGFSWPVVSAEQCSPAPPPCRMPLRPEELRLQICSLRTRSAPGTLDEHGFEPRRVVAHPRGTALACTLVEPRHDASPRQ